MDPTSELPDSFSDWNVQVEPHPGTRGVLDLVFDSPLLEKRITNRVYLPSSYRPDGPALPVMYYLHGTVEPALDNPVVGPVTQHEALLDAIGPGGGARQTDIFRFEEQRDRAQYLLVAPDTAYEDTICETCIWIDGRPDPVPTAPPATAETLPADSFLHQELYPLVEALFNVRHDRGGRGVCRRFVEADPARVPRTLTPSRQAAGGDQRGGLGGDPAVASGRGAADQGDRPTARVGAEYGAFCAA
ncbi:hypothetical protein [Pseudonocardia alni]|uniref:hypothetical protein n=1 Tax=Pseudonocardia alni TaxID=33907 RepID=UPI00386E1889